MTAQITPISGSKSPSEGPSPSSKVPLLSLKTHNLLDYALGAFLLLCPSLFGFSGVSSARNTFLNLGFGLVGYSFFTRYRYSLFKLIPLGFHMFLDVVLGISMILAPWVLGYRPLITTGQYALHWIVGAAAILMVTITRTRAESAAAPEDREEFREAA